MIIHKLSLPFGTAVPNYYSVKSGTPRILVRIEQFFMAHQSIFIQIYGLAAV